MKNSSLDLSPLVHATPGPPPEARERLAAGLQALIQSEQAGHTKPWRAWRRASLTHRVLVVAVAAAIVVVFFVPLPHVSLLHSLVSPVKVTTPTKLPVVDLSATPKRWVPVAYGDAQVSVPSFFSVHYPGMPCTRVAAWGMVLLANAPHGAGRATSCPMHSHATHVELIPMRRVPAIYAHEKPVILNGVSVYRVLADAPIPIAELDAPSLGIEVIARGALANAVADTLSRSPRTLVLARGAAPVIPASWHTVSFMGLAFAAPQSWRLTRTTFTVLIGGPCNIARAFSGGVVLSTDKSVTMVGCYAARLVFPQDSVLVDAVSRTLSQGRLGLALSTSCLSLRSLTVCPATSPAYFSLIVKVAMLGRNNPVFVSIGLAGNGMVARTILYSLRAATPR